jgi:PRTRC genetic system protein B
MKDITSTFGALYTPVKAFLVYEKSGTEKNVYVESYDIDRNGCPVNAHPLSIKESTEMAKALDTSDELKRNFLKPSGLLPKNVLYINPDHDGYAVWTSPKQQVDLFFIENLNIPNGRASVPALLWKASKTELRIFAIEADENINEHTALYQAPFFNLYEDGKVCMGTVQIQIDPDCLLEEFIKKWQEYFFNSFFSHLIKSKSPVKGNIIQMWQSLSGTKKAFPVKSLLKNGLTLKSIIL